MIAQLHGKIISKKPTKIIIDVNGIGFEVNITTTTFESIGNSEEISIFTYLSVREDSLTLYGFSSIAEKEMFQLLISISGIGPKLAQGILSGIQIEELKLAIQERNISRIIAIPGVGKKTAERLLVELKDKVASLEGTFERDVSSISGKKSDAIAALVSLGYNQKQANNIVAKLLAQNSDISIEELIRLALTNVNK